MVTRTDLKIKSVPTEAENTIEAIQLLHSMGTPAATIARRLHLDQATVLHVIKTGTLPQRQLSLAWVEDATESPTYEREGQR